MKIDPDANEYRSTRLVCAKLYEGGLLSCYLIIDSTQNLKLKEIEMNQFHQKKAFFWKKP